MAKDEPNSILPLIGLGLLTLAAVSIPVWLPILLGTKPKFCKCGVELCASGVCPVCGCKY